MHPSLRLVGIMPPLDMAHHLRKTDDSPYREGVVQSVTEDGVLSVDIGLDEVALVKGSAAANTRVTVDLQTQPHTLVSPSVPRAKLGLPWGYSVRVASSIATAVIPSEAAHQPYDLLIGLSERGKPINDLPAQFDNFSRALIVLGGLSGLELSIEHEYDTLALKAEDAGDLFDQWVNICPDQGSRTIRTEEGSFLRLFPAPTSRR